MKKNHIKTGIKPPNGLL